MKIPRGFFIFLGIIQVVLIGTHVILALAVLFFFPALQPHALFVWIFFLLASISFLAFSVLDWKSENPILRWGYIISGIWMPVWFYSLLAAGLAAALYVAHAETGTAAARVLFAAAGFLALYGVVNARVLRISKLSVPLPNLPQYWKGKTAVMVTDLHLGHVLRYGFAGRVIARINRLQPDIVFISGDFFDGVKTNFADLANVFKAIQSTHGIFFVSGNHEEFAGYKVCEDAIRGAGIKILENEKMEIEGLQIAGLAYAGESAETDEQVRELIGKMHIDSSRPSILLKHVPNKAQVIAEAGISLQLSGHTHHGQIWPGRLITRRVFKGFDYGLKKIGPNFIYTSSGVGTWGPPVRIFTKSEIVKIVFE